MVNNVINHDPNKFSVKTIKDKKGNIVEHRIVNKEKQPEIKSWALSKNDLSSFPVAGFFLSPPVIELQTSPAFWLIVSKNPGSSCPGVGGVNPLGKLISIPLGIAFPKDKPLVIIHKKTKKAKTNFIEQGQFVYLRKEDFFEILKQLKNQKK